MILFLLAAAGPFSWPSRDCSKRTPGGRIRTISDHPVVILLIVTCRAARRRQPARAASRNGDLPARAAPDRAATCGIDPIDFGAVVVINLIIGMLHPPVGLLNFVVATISGERVTLVARASLAFLGWALVVLFLIVVFPPLDARGCRGRFDDGQRAVPNGRSTRPIEPRPRLARLNHLPAQDQRAPQRQRTGSAAEWTAMPAVGRARSSTRAATSHLSLPEHERETADRIRSGSARLAPRLSFNP